jgi:predicted Zn-dependent protease
MLTLGRAMIKYNSILFAALFLCLACATVVLADYNPATGEDDVIFIGEAKEVRMGISLAKSVEGKFGLLKDAGLQERVRTLGQRIADVCDRPELTYSFRVLDGGELEEEQRHNAFALPGGYVYIFKEMAEDTQSDDELAAILAHEVGHIVAKHSIKKLQGSIGMAGLSLLGAAAGSDGRTQRKTSIAITELMMAYNRQAEYEADKLSVKYLKKASFDPNAAVAFIDRMLEKKLKGEIHRYHYFRTHPYISERKAMMNKEIRGRLDFNDYINVPTEDEKPF